MPQIRVKVGSTTYWLSEIVLAQWFPGLYQQSHFNNHVDLDDIVDEIRHQFPSHGHIDIRDKTVKEAFRDLLHALNHPFSGSKTAQVQTKLEQLLRADMHSPRLSGLKYSRYRFLILCALARYTTSPYLAQALVGFLSRNVYEVVEGEAPFHLHEWGVGLNQLRYLADEATLQYLLSCLMRPGMGHMNHWHNPPVYDPMAALVAKAMQYPRGRRLLTDSPGWGVRARSAPPMRHRHRSPDWRIAPFRYPSSGWPSPAMSPIPSPMNSYFPDVEALQYEQEVQGEELDELHWRVRMLENGRM